MNYTNEQVAAINSPAQCVAVVACPGSGKTTIIVARAIAAAERNEKVIIFAYTNSAANEIRARVKSCPFSYNITITTFHAFAYSLVVKNFSDLGYKAPPIILDEDETESVICEILEDFGYNKKGKGYPTKTDCRHFMAGKSEEIKEDRRGKVKSVIDEYENRLKIKNQIDFYLMIQSALFLCGRTENEMNCNIMIDEAQDVDASIWEFVELWKKTNSRLTIVGDPRQAIFQWRGGDATAFMEYTKEWIQFDITKNQRSALAITRQANNIIPRQVRQYEPTLDVPFMVSTRHEEGKIIELEFDDELLLSIFSHPEAGGSRAILAPTNDELDNLEETYNREMPGESAQYVRIRPHKLTSVQIEVRNYFRGRIDPYNYKVKVSDLSEDAQAEVGLVDELYQDAEYLSSLARGELNTTDPHTTAPITLSTIHGAKGREFDEVVIFTNKLQADTVNNRRLLYVAITRAKSAVAFIPNIPEWARCFNYYNNSESATL